MREVVLMAIELLPQLLTPPFLSLPSRAEPQSQGNSQVLLDAPIQLSKITENYGECVERLNQLLSPFSQPPDPSHLSPVAQNSWYLFSIGPDCRS